MEATVLCSYCGRENPDLYRYCGMCGKALERPSAAPPQEAEVNGAEERPDSYRPLEPAFGAPPVPSADELSYLWPRVTRESGLASTPSEPKSTTVGAISGPSFLGLDDPPAQDTNYLLEDETSSKGRYLVAFLLLVAIGVAGWWEVRKHGGRAWLYAMLRGQHLIGSRGGEDGVPADRLNRSKVALEESANNPNASKSADFQLRDGLLLGKPGEEMDLGKSAAPKAAGAPEGGASQASLPSSSATSAPPQAAAAEAEQGAPSNGNVNAEQAVRKPSGGDESSSAPTAAAAGAEKAVRKPTVESASARSKVTPLSGTEQAGKSGAEAEDEQTTRIAEKYLYGQGVPQDCNRALSLLRPAADASNVKARALLGSMYATGHCVPRDLPNSYRWFALALRQQPNNAWVAKDLEMVWNQMDASQKQLAMRMAK